MDSRKVIKIKNSYYINIPLETAKALGIQKGERLQSTYLPGSGIFITQAWGADKIPINPESVDRLQGAADAILSRHERNLKNLEINFLSNVHASIITDLVKIGVFDLKREVENVKKQVEESNKGKGRLSLVRKRKGDVQ